MASFIKHNIDCLFSFLISSTQVQLEQKFSFQKQLLQHLLYKVIN